MTFNEHILSATDLARVREAQRRIAATPRAVPADATRIQVNPFLEIVEISLQQRSVTAFQQPANFCIVWRNPADGSIRTQIAAPGDLAALKVVLEEKRAEDAAREAGAGVGLIDACMKGAAEKGLIIVPPSRLRRPSSLSSLPGRDDELPAAVVFTLQWHITQECDLHCRHCYDRSSRGSFSLSAGLRLLADLRRFCEDRFVRGHVSFTGGNPFLHPDFATLYRRAADLALSTAILGNPVSREQLSEIVGIQRPAYFQVSLEGLGPHNDHIRGPGHFRRTLAFLDLLTELGVGSEVMLTLTRDNMDQVLPLGEMLRGRTGAFSFNRLAPFGEGAALALPDRKSYAAFLDRYVSATKDNPVLALKDNLLNLALARRERELFNGCAGYGCGAAFNFMAILADGEAHACRKFPSPIGSVHTSSLAEIYDSSAANRYRSRSAACTGCPFVAVCGGCPAVTAGTGGDPFLDLDPLCFREERP